MESEPEIVGGSALEEVKQKSRWGWFGGDQKESTSARAKAVFGLPGRAATPAGAQSPPKTLFESIARDYYEILDNPKRLPGLFHPLISKERALSISENRNFISHPFYLTDEYKVKRKLVLNMQIENLAVGATGGLLVGIGTHAFFGANQGRLKFIAQALKTFNFNATEAAGGKPPSMLMTGSIVAWRISRQAALGAVLFDCLKRSSEMKGDEDDWKHSAFAGAVCGGLFGLRGGPAGMVIGTASICGLATAQHIAPNLFKPSF